MYLGIRTQLYLCVPLEKNLGLCILTASPPHKLLFLTSSSSSQAPPPHKFLLTSSASSSKAPSLGLTLSSLLSPFSKLSIIYIYINVLELQKSYRNSAENFLAPNVRARHSSGTAITSEPSWHLMVDWSPDIAQTEQVYRLFFFLLILNITQDAMFRVDIGSLEIPLGVSFLDFPCFW